MKKKTAWIGTIFTLCLFIFFLVIGIVANKLWLIIISSIMISIYLIALVILIIDYIQTRDKVNIKIQRYTKTKCHL